LALVAQEDTLASAAIVTPASTVPEACWVHSFRPVAVPVAALVMTLFLSIISMDMPVAPVAALVLTAASVALG